MLKISPLQKLVVTKQFVTVKSRKKVIANRSWFTVVQTDRWTDFVKQKTLTIYKDYQYRQMDRLRKALDSDYMETIRTDRQTCEAKDLNYIK